MLTVRNVPIICHARLGRIRHKPITVTKPFLRTINRGQAIHNVQMRRQRLAMTAQHARMSVRIAQMHLNALMLRHVLTSQHVLMTARKEQM